MRKYKNIYKKENSPYWYYQFKINGKKIRGSTGTTNQREAYKIALLKKTQISNEIKNPNKFKGKTWEDARDRWLGAKDIKAKNEFIRLKWFNKRLSGKKLKNIDADLVWKLQQEQIASGKAKQSIDRDFNQLKSILNQAYKIGWLEKLPIIEKLGKDVERHRDLKEEERIRLEKSLPQYLVDPINFYLMTGLRKSELVNLTWDQIDLNKKRIRFKEDEHKNEEFAYIPLNNKAIEILKRNKGNHKNLVFVGRSKLTGGLGDFKKAWASALQKANIKDLKIHDLRHHVGATLAEQEVSESYIAEMLRHKTQSTTRRYTKARDSKLREYAELLH